MGKLHWRGNSAAVGGDLLRYGKRPAFRRLAGIFAAALIVGVTGPALAAPVFYTCKSIGVAVYAERIHVQCDKPASGGYSYFALSTTNSAHAARILSVLTAAHLAGRSIVVEYDPSDTSGTAFGCLAHDCRRLMSVGLQ